MSFPVSQKTVIVLDHGPASQGLGNEPVEYDIFTKSRGPGIIPLAPIVKSMWTCNVEAAVEYARIVYDLYPSQKFLRLVASDSEAKALNSWEYAEQNLQQLMVELATMGASEHEMLDKESDIVYGLKEAVQLLCEPTLLQLKMDPAEIESKAANKGRIVCLTFLKNDNQVRVLEERVQEIITECNKTAADSDGKLLPIDFCELVVVHLFPTGGQTAVTQRDKQQISSLCSLEVHLSQSGHFIATKMVELCVQHFNLASTCITGIPMKEEQNASSSANYDVELLHPADAHYELYKSDHIEGLLIPSKEGLYMNTFTLKWCTPKSNTVELHYTTGSYRLTPVDVTSRPSSCLTNFLLSGRAVMLEQPRKSGAKVISHMLASHGGEIYIHVLATSRSNLEDPPSISEGAGGRITDYRIKDFGELMKDCRLAPSLPSETSDVSPIAKAKARAEKLTRFWPMTISDTIIFNMMAHVDPLPPLLMKDALNDEEVLECKKVIYHLVAMENKNEALPTPNTGTRGKGPKRDEHYRQMWVELERLVRAYSAVSASHGQVLECLLECKKPKEGSASAWKPQPPEDESDVAMKELEAYQKMTEREKVEFNAKAIKTEPIPPKKAKLAEPLKKGVSNGRSLLSLWTSQLTALHSQRRNEFAGRLEISGDKAELYINLKEEDILDKKSSNSNSNHNGRPNKPNSTNRGQKLGSIMKHKK